ncbi:MAG: MFS transporter [Anaerolineae bacterium]|nr:MFS transporter [Anaerolineae bacterium]
MQAAPAESAPINRKSLLFILVTAFLNLAGIGLLAPVIKFLVEGYVSDPGEVAIATGLLFTSYSFFQFLAVPTLGALSDRYGRRPILLLCLFGSSLGYLIFGIGGALWILFLGRIIDGVTGGNIGTIYAYIADLTPPKERTRYFGLIGAIAGLGFVFGPAIGGILTRVGGTATPVFFAALVTFLNVIWGYFAMPESLRPEQRMERISLVKLNPFWQLRDVFRIPQLRWLLLATFLWMTPFAMLQSNLAVLGSDWLGAREQDIALVFTIIGLIIVIVQGGLIYPLLRFFSESQLTLAGMVLFAIGFCFYALIPSTRSNGTLLAAVIVLPFGNALITPTIASLTSQAVGPREQGRVQGGSQSVQAFARVIGPTLGGYAYAEIGAASPYVAGVVFLIIAAVCVLLALPDLRAAMANS